MKVFRLQKNADRFVSSSMLRVLVLTAVGVFNSGCAVGPDYSAPSSELAPFHNKIAAASVNAPAAPLDKWWRGFNDPMLVAVVNQTLQQNLDLEAAFARVQQTRAVASAAGADLLPTIDLDGDATAQKQSLNSPIGSLARTFPGYSRYQRDYSIGPVASWEIDLAGGLGRNAAAALAEVAAAEAERVGTRITVAADSADAYLQVRGLQNRLLVAEDQISTDTQLLELVKVRQKVGSADEREVAQAEAVLRQARATLPSLRTQLEAQLNRLDVLMGSQPGQNSKALATVSEVPGIPLIDSHDTPADVLRRRPDVIAAERRLAASSERIGAAISDYYPKLSLSGALGFESTVAGHLFRSQSFQPTGTVGIRWRLFDFGKVDAEVAQAKGANAEALAIYRQVVLRATEDVENSVMALAQSDIRVQEIEGEVDALTRSRNLSEIAYKAGAITLTDVLDADRQLLVARDQLSSMRAGRARAAVGLFRALGGGWGSGSASGVETALNHRPPALEN